MALVGLQHADRAARSSHTPHFFRGKVVSQRALHHSSILCPARQVGLCPHRAALPWDGNVSLQPCHKALRPACKAQLNAFCLSRTPVAITKIRLHQLYPYNHTCAGDCEASDQGWYLAAMPPAGSASSSAASSTTASPRPTGWGAGLGRHVLLQGTRTSIRQAFTIGSANETQLLPQAPLQCLFEGT